MTAREEILHRVRVALGRSDGQPPADPPPVPLQVPQMDADSKLESFFRAVEKLAGKAWRAPSLSEARDYAAALIGDGRAVASNAPLLRECGIAGLPSVQTGILDRAQLLEACASADVGITGADYALADTGTVVLFSSPEEARMISLLPPVHLALVSAGRILSGLDEFLALMPLPAEQSSSTVLITGPSRTADIEQILVRGVHGPGEIHVVVI